MEAIPNSLPVLLGLQERVEYHFLQLIRSSTDNSLFNRVRVIRQLFMQWTKCGEGPSLG